MIWTGPTSLSDSSLDYFIPEHLKNEFGKIHAELSGFLTSKRLEKLQTIVNKRCRKVLTVFENTHHAHNISAILRTIDVFGFLDLFFVYSNPDMRFRSTDAIDRGASQWLMPKRTTSIPECARILKNNGYKIALVSLPDFSRTAESYKNQIPSFSSSQFLTKEFDKTVDDKKIALIFGSELHGVSPDWIEFADMYVSVKMYGFTESLNVSVCAAIILQSLREKFELENKNIYLSQEHQKLLLEHWVAKTCSNAYEYVNLRKPELMDWFLFVRSGKFFQPFESNSNKIIDP